MRNIFKNRWLFFFLGLSVGVVLSLLVLKFNENKKTWNTYEVPVEIVQEQKKPDIKTPPVKKKKKKKKKPPKTETIPVDTHLIAMTNDSLINDSLTKDTITILDSTNFHSEPVDIVVAKDELLFSKQIIPSGDARLFLCDNSSELDSLLVDNITTNSGEGILVEFWKSPVNFIGYKLSKRRLILYGIMEFNSVNLEYQIDKSLILHYKKQDFELKCTQDFIQLNVRK